MTRRVGRPAVGAAGWLSASAHRTTRRSFGSRLLEVGGWTMAAAGAWTLGGCAGPKMADSARAGQERRLGQPEPTARRAALRRLGDGRPGKLAVGAARPAAGDVSSALSSSSSSPLPSGDDAPSSAFTQALHDALLRDLATIGVLDAAAPTRLEAVVSARRGSAAVELRVTVTRAGYTRLNKHYRVDAPPAPAPATVQSLLDQLYDDPEFNLAVKD